MTSRDLQKKHNLCFVAPGNPVVLRAPNLDLPQGGGED